MLRGFRRAHNVVWVSEGRFFGLGGGVDGRGLCGRIFPLRNMSWGKINSMKRAQDFLALL